MFSKKKSYLGIDIGAAGIKLVELHLDKKRPVLFTYGIASDRHDVHELSKHQLLTLADEKNTENKEAGVDIMNQRIDQSRVENYAQKIKTLCKACQVSSKKAVVSLPVSSIFHAIVTLPKTDKKDDLKQMIRGEVKKFVPFPLTEMALDYQVLNNELTKSKTQKVLVNAVPNILINFYSQVFQKAGIILEALEPESTALTRSLVGHDSSVTMIIDIGAKRTNFFIIDQTIPITHQSIDFGGFKVDKILGNILGLPADQVNQIKKDLFAYDSLSGQNMVEKITSDEIAQILKPVVDPIIKEIEISFELYFRQAGNTGKKPEKIILTGGSAFIPYLTELIAQRFKLKCYIGDPWSRAVYQQSLKPVLNEIGPRMSVAIGLALRNML